MTYPRRSVDLSGYSDLVVVYLGYRAKGLKGVCSPLRIGRGLRSIKKDPPDGLLSHEDFWFGAGNASPRTAEETITLIVRM